MRVTSENLWWFYIDYSLIVALDSLESHYFPGNLETFDFRPNLHWPRMKALSSTINSVNIIGSLYENDRNSLPKLKSLCTLALRNPVDSNTVETM